MGSPAAILGALRWTVVVAFVVVVVGSLMASAADDCSWIESSNENCLKMAVCDDRGTELHIWEDCEKGSDLLTVDGSVSLGPCPHFSVKGRTLALATEFDAEEVGAGAPPLCPGLVSPGPPTTTIAVEDVNEFFPDPVGHGQTIQVPVLEGQEPEVVATLTYSDRDWQETESLTFETVTQEFNDEFAMEKEFNGREMEFRLRTRKGLDFEALMYYKLVYNITSVDGRYEARTTQQVILVSVEDIGDNVPYWTSYYPSFSLEECEAGTELYVVEARDRDVIVNNDIHYSITGGNDDGYFKVDGDSGRVTTDRTIDREVLALDGIRDFSIILTATEYENGIPVHPLSNSSQVSRVFIVDVNNKVPEFTDGAFSIEMDELTGNDAILDLEIYVYDMDEGDKGTFLLTSSQPDDLEVTPAQGMSNQSVTLKALWRGEETFFDYEHQQDAALNFVITATEKADANHVGITNIAITLNDVNDNSPEFDSSEYSITLSETTELGVLVTTVAANDADVSPHYGFESIRYFLKSCPQLEVNETTGEVTLESALDYETYHTISCNVEARDEYGSMSGQSGNGIIYITVEDAVDEPPEFVQLSSMEVIENSNTETYIGTIKAKDEDEGAEISFHIDWDNSVPYSNGTLVDVNAIVGWFALEETVSTYSEYEVNVVVGNAQPNREVADRVVLTIVVVDNATEVNGKSSAGTVEIIIHDENDEYPAFKGQYDDIAVKENVESGTTIFQIQATDPDLNDEITFSIDNDTLVNLSEPKLEVGVFKINVEVQEGGNIDREVMASFEINVVIADTVNHTESLQIIINVTDVNDNAPMMNPGVCDRVIDFHENANDGDHVTFIAASDNDMEGAHKEVVYSLLNEHLEGEKNRRLPFKVDSGTGELVVFLDDDNRVVNREQDDTWELIFKAYDHCEVDEAQGCTVLQSDECYININVLDVNDEAPGDFQWTPNDDPLEVDEFMKEGDEAKAPSSAVYKITAQDGDLKNTNNTRLTFVVLAVRVSGTEDDKGLFIADSKEEPWSGDSPILYYSTLRAAKDLNGTKGLYEIDIMATDHGEPPLNGNKTIMILVKDANDHAPHFRFEGCLDTDLPTVYMEENFYEAGDEVMCTDNGYALEIYVDDADDGDNRKVNVTIDYENSAVNVEGEGQMRAFVIKQKEGYKYTLQVTEKIDKEKGGIYNLSLYAVDLGEPPLATTAMVQVIVSNDFEYPPYFCDTGICTETLIMVENDPDVSATFNEATDKDNENVDPNDPINYDKVYYYIVGGSIDDFVLEDSTSTVLRLKNKPIGLDREDIPEYPLTIAAINSDGDIGPIVGMPDRNNTLYIKIVVQDENDNPPVFPYETAFASFTTSNQIGETVLVVKAEDRDLNETLVYGLKDDFEWFNTTFKPENPFKIEQGPNNTAELILDFTPTAAHGFCTFTITVSDKVGHEQTTKAKVYVISQDYQLPVYFKNDLELVQQKEMLIANIFTMVYGYQCIIDTIAKTQDELGENIVGETTVTMHFIDDVKNTPVDVNIIIEATANDVVIKDLWDRLQSIGLNLDYVGTYPTGNDGNSLEQKVLVLEVLLGVVSLVLGLLVIMVLTAYCIRTKSLERRVHVMSTNVFGSKSSDLNRLGMDMTAIPGSNKFTAEGANPMYNMPETDLRNDSSSISSGDSVLVGVEDNPEFKNYKAGRSNNPLGFDNFISNRSIDEVSVQAPPNGGSRTNPLLGLESEAKDHDLSDGLAGFEVTIRRSSSGSEDESADGYQNPNFSFGI